MLNVLVFRTLLILVLLLFLAVTLGTISAKGCALVSDGQLINFVRIAMMLKAYGTGRFLLCFFI